MKGTNRIRGRVHKWGVITALMGLLASCAPRGTQTLATPTPLGVPTAVQSVVPSATAATPQGITPVATPQVTMPIATPTEPHTAVPSGEGAIIGAALWPDEIASLCPEMPEWGIYAANMWISWGSFEPKKGQFDWSATDQLFSTMRSCGMAIGVHITSQSTWATQTWTGVQVKQRSMPPLNMQDYYDAVYALAARYKGQGIRFSIENEATVRFLWGGTVDEYASLLKTGYQAIKAADPSAVVENDGILSASLFLLVAADMFTQGQRQQAVDYLSQGWANYPPSTLVTRGFATEVSSPTQFEDLMRSEFGQRQLEWLDMLLANHQYYDVLQLHYHSPQVEMLPGVIQWFRQKMQAAGFDKPIELWELGWSWDDAATYDRTVQAQAVPKYLGSAVGEGVHYMVYGRWSGRSTAPDTLIYSLVSAQGPKPAAAAYQASALKLNGVTSAERLDLPAGLWGYRYYRAGEEFYMVWRTQPGSGTVALPVDAASVRVTDLVTQATSQADPQAIPLGDDPLLVELP
jgi:hypothetical protein